MGKLVGGRKTVKAKVKRGKFIDKGGEGRVYEAEVTVKRKGRQKTTFSAGLINNNMAERVENALILATDDDKPIGIIGNAASVVKTSDPLANYRTPEARSKLFRSRYPLAWSNRLRVTADAFLCGKVTISPDYQQCTVSIEAP